MTSLQLRPYRAYCRCGHMPTRIQALVNPTLLIWSRGKAGYRIDEVARRLRVTDAQIQSWESGHAKPSIRQARLPALA